MNHYPILFISLGPGDPELITLKGWKALQAADIVFCPETEGRGATESAPRAQRTSCGGSAWATTTSAASCYP